MKKRQIVNIINFIRGCEPRCEMDLVTPVKEQIKLLKKHNFKGTFLIQYDALCNPVYTDLLKNECSDGTEIGVWLEIVQSLAEDSGISWRGRFPWDWYSNVGFPAGYTVDERERIVDTLFERFHEIFGYYPASLGSWAIDAHTLQYARIKYGIDASCNCKDQWGTDGYTLWGGYYNQAYYPSLDNMFSPAQTADRQINVPVFRMLGSDPVYQYDAGLNLEGSASEWQHVVSLEPVYTGKTGGGGVPSWVDWYFKENFNLKCLAFSYTQVGQENSFGWDGMKDGLNDQFEKLATLQKNGTVEIETLGESGRWFKKTFPLTPATTIVTDTDWKNEGRKTIWYNCKNYRANIMIKGNTFWFRDLFIFSQFYAERYFATTCKTPLMQFDNLPLIDGNRFSGDGIRAGLYPCVDGKPLTFSDYSYEETDETTAKVTFTGTECGDISIIFSEDSVTFTVSGNNSKLSLCERHSPRIKDVLKAENTFRGLMLTYNGYEYYPQITSGVLTYDGNVTIKPENGIIKLSLN